MKLWNSVLECWFYYCLLEQVLFRLILAIPEHSFCLCVSSFFFWIRLFRDSNSIYGFCYDALCVNIFFYSLLFVNVLLWEWVWKSEVEKNLEMTTHAWDEKCILLLNIWPRIKRKDDCSHPRNKFTWIIGRNHYCWSNHLFYCKFDHELHRIN